jgi:hypothetical protein
VAISVLRQINAFSLNHALNAMLLQNQPSPSTEGKALILSSIRALTAGFF